MKSNTLISIQTIFDNTNLAENIESKKLRASILTSQDMELQDLLGSELYDFIYTKRTDEGEWTGLTSDQTTFVENYMEPTLMYYSVSNFVKTHWMDIVNIGIVVNNSDTSTSITNAEADKMSLFYMDKANFYAARLKKWICDEQNNNNTDPMFALYEEPEQNLTPSLISDESPIYFPTRSDCGCSIYTCNCKW